MVRTGKSPGSAGVAPRARAAGFASSMLAAVTCLRAAPGMAVCLALPCLFACGGQEFTAGSPGTATPDASLDAANGGGPGFCASQPAGLALCSDFDEQPLPENWNDIVANGGSPVSENDAGSVSPPNSLLASTPALSAGEPMTQAFVTKTKLPAGATHIAFEMRVDELSFPSGAAGASLVPVLYTQRGYEIILGFVPSPSASPFEFDLVEASLDQLPDGGTTYTAHDLTSLFTQGSGLGEWQSITLDLDIDHGSNAAVVTVGSASSTVTLRPPTGTANGARTFSLGLQATPPTGETKIRFDNVTYSAAN